MSEWASFYVMVGSSGAALIGMQFVVVTLIASQRQRPHRVVSNSRGDATKRG